MTEGLVRESTLAVKKEGAYGVDPTVAAANVIRFNGAGTDLNFDYADIAVDEIKNTKDEYPSLLGDEVTGNSIAINMRGPDTPGSAPEGDPLYECALGVKNTNAQSVTAAGSTTAKIVLTGGGGAGFAVGDAVANVCPTATTYTTDAGSTTTSIVLTVVPANFSIGDIVQVPNGDGSALIEPTRITAINNKTLTVSPALTGAPNAAMTVKKVTIEITWITSISPADNLNISPSVSAAMDQKVRVRAGAHYKLTTADLPSFFASFWRGDIVREDYLGNKVSSLEIDSTIGQVIVPKFSFLGKHNTRTTQTYSGSGLGAASFNTLDPLIGKEMAMKIAGSTVYCDKLMWRLNNEIYQRKSLVTTGIYKLIHTGRTVEISFDTEYESKDIQDALVNASTSELIAVYGRYGYINGNVCAVRFPAIRYKKVPIKDQNKVWKYGINAVAQLTSGEDSVASLSFL